MVALREYNKRSKVKLASAELELIKGMRTFSPEKICGAFTALTGKEIGVGDVELIFLIMDLESALAPAVIRAPLIGSPSVPWPGTQSPYTQRYDIMCRTD